MPILSLKTRVEVIELFYKEKGFYISLACGIVALIAFAVICYNLIGGTGDGDGDSAMIAEATASPTAVPTEEPVVKESMSKATATKVPEKTEKPKATKAPEKKTVETDAEPMKNTLHFDQELGLLWPVNGEILMDYSADQVVYFKTLAQYRTNPAILIAAKEGDVVKASADGIVADIVSSEETGRTVTMEIGDNFSVKYGQLKEVAVQKGDTVSEGQVIGKVAAATSYYLKEGTNLYFQVLEKDVPVNPMLLLR